MPDQTSKGMNCNEFDLLLTDMLDGVLSGSELDRFQAHARVCGTCGPLLADAEAGCSWLKSLTEVEAPANLVTSILASTTGVDTQRLRAPARVQPQISWLEHMQASLSGYLEPIWATVRQPRFAMSFGMAFFALSVGLTVAGVKPADLRQISLRPTAIRHTYYNTQARVVRYYENMPSLDRGNPGRPEKTTATTHHNSPNRSRSATIARPRTISCWPRLRWVRLSLIRQIRICL